MIVPLCRNGFTFRSRRDRRRRGRGRKALRRRSPEQDKSGMEESGEPKRKRDDVVREIGETLMTAFAAEDVEGARAILFHDPGKAGLTVDEALAVIHGPDPTPAWNRPITVFSARCLINDVPLLSLMLEYLEENDRLGTIDDRDQDGQTPLWWASFVGSLEAATILLDRGADFNKGTVEGTPLHMACVGGHDAVVKLLLANGADKNCSDSEFGWRPIDLACIDGHEQVLSTLLVFKADFG